MGRGGHTRVLACLHEAAERNGQVGEAEGLKDRDEDAAANIFAGAIFPMRLGRLDVEIGDVAISTT